MKRKTKRYLSALRALSAMAACAGLAGLGISSARATIVLPNQLPGHGTVVNGTATATGNYGAGGHGHILVGSSNTVIDWGNTGGSIGASQPGGFNIGGHAHLGISGGAGTSLLNVDLSGNPSQILGMMNTNIPTFVANANGIIVGTGARIVAPAGIGFIAATVNEKQFASNGSLPISFTASGPLTVAGNLIAAGGPGTSIILAGSGAVNIAPRPNGAAHYFKPGTNVTVVGGVGGTFSAGVFTPMDAKGSSTPSAKGLTAVTLDLGTLAHPYNLSLSDPNAVAPTVGTMVLAKGSIVNNGVLTSNTGNLIPYFQWTGWLINNGTIHAQLDSSAGPGGAGMVSFQGNTSADLAYGGLINKGTIAINDSSPLLVNLPGSIINRAMISNVSGEVALLAGNVALPLFPGVGGAVINHGTVVASNGVVLAASNPNKVGPYSGGGVISDGMIRFLDASAHTDAVLVVGSLTGNAYLGGIVATSHDPQGLYRAYFQSGRTPDAIFTLGADVMAQNLVYFTGGSLRGPGTVRTNTLDLTDFVGNVYNLTSSTNILANGFHVANGLSGSTHIILNMPTTSQGATVPQDVNLHVAGNAILTSHGTSTFVNSVVNSSGNSYASLPTEANVGSRLVVHATGNLTVNGSSTGPTDHSLSQLSLSTNGFVFPGGIVLISGSTLTLNTVVDNGYSSTAVAPTQGISFVAPHIVENSPLTAVITNANSLVHFSTKPLIAPTIYEVAAVSGLPGAYTIAEEP